MDWSRIIDFIEKKLPNVNLSKSLGVRTQFISDLKSGKSKNPNSEFVLKLISILNVNPEWFLNEEESFFNKDISTNETTLSISATKIPLLRQSVSCGNGVEWQDDNVEKYLELLEYLPALQKKDVFAFKASGTSMVGLGINDGDILFFDGSKGQKLKDDVYVFGFGGEAYCKFLKFEPFEQKVRVYSVHTENLQKAELVKVINADADGFQIFGRVLAWMHENRLMKR
ncbi:MAG: XRE family transcriptional regulator [Treponemataceae bacterium]